MNEEDRRKFDALVGQVVLLRRLVAYLYSMRFSAENLEEFIEELDIPTAFVDPRQTQVVESATTDFTNDVRDFIALNSEGKFSLG